MIPRSTMNSRWWWQQRQIVDDGRYHLKRTHKSWRYHSIHWRVSSVGARSRACAKHLYWDGVNVGIRRIGRIRRKERHRHGHIVVGASVIHVDWRHDWMMGAFFSADGAENWPAWLSLLKRSTSIWRYWAGMMASFKRNDGGRKENEGLLQSITCCENFLVPAFWLFGRCDPMLLLATNDRLPTHLRVINSCP